MSKNQGEVGTDGKLELSKQSSVESEKSPQRSKDILDLYSGDGCKWIGAVVDPIHKNLHQPAAKFADALHKLSDRALTDNGMGGSIARAVAVEGHGLWKSAGGLANATHEAVFVHPDRTAVTAALGAVTGAGLRIALTKAGAAKSLVGTVMLGAFAIDAAQPHFKAIASVSGSTKGKSLAEINAELEKTSTALGDANGRFGLDMVIGGLFGMAGEAGADRAMKRMMSPARYTSFERGKEWFWTSEESPVGSAFNRVTTAVDAISKKISTDLLRKPQEVDWSKVSKEEAIEAVSRTIIDTNKFKKNRGIVDVEGVKLFNTLEAKIKPVKITNINVEQPNISIRGNGIKDINSKLKLNENAGEASSAGAEKLPAKVPTKPLSGSEFYDEMKPEVLEGIAKVASESMEARPEPRYQTDLGRSGRYPGRQISVNDHNNFVKGAVESASDGSRRGRVVDERLDESAGAIVRLTDMVKSPRDLAAIGDYTDLHGQAATQMIRTNNNYNTVALNLQALECHDMVISGLKRNGITDKVLSSKDPSLFAIADDQGAGNYTFPPLEIANIRIARPVTLFPRNQEEIRYLLTLVNLHEVLGHDHIYGSLTLFPAEVSKTVIPKSLEIALGKRALEKVDGEHVPEIVKGRTWKDILTWLLGNQRNENSSDLAASAYGGSGAVDALTTLLMSLREGGKLDHRTVIGKMYAQTENPREIPFEAHGIDIWRALLQLEMCKQKLLPKGVDVNNAAEYTKAVDGLSPAVKRQFDYYIQMERSIFEAGDKGDVYRVLSRDEKGKYFDIPKELLDSVIRPLVKVQLDTPLESLEGKTFRDITSQSAEIFAKARNISDWMVNEVEGRASGRIKASEPVINPYDVKDLSLMALYNACTMTMKRCLAKGLDPKVVLAEMNRTANAIEAEYCRAHMDRFNKSTPPVGEALVKDGPKRALEVAVGKLADRQRDIRHAVANTAGIQGGMTTAEMADRYLNAKSKVQSKANLVQSSYRPVDTNLSTSFSVSPSDASLAQYLLGKQSKAVNLTGKDLDRLFDRK